VQPILPHIDAPVPTAVIPNKEMHDKNEPMRDIIPKLNGHFHESPSKMPLGSMPIYIKQQVIAEPQHYIVPFGKYEESMKKCDGKFIVKLETPVYNGENITINTIYLQAPGIF